MFARKGLVQRVLNRKKRNKFHKELDLFVLIQTEKQKAIWEYQDRLSALGYDFLTSKP